MKIFNYVWISKIHNLDENQKVKKEAKIRATSFKQALHLRTKSKASIGNTLHNRIIYHLLFDKGYQKCIRERINHIQI